MKFKYSWKMKDGYPQKNGLKVFSCFACGGGSTMGYKLAGYDVIGCNEIDPEMMKIYKKNHNPKYSFLCDIRDFLNLNFLPKELYDLDILDGSPPCSVFSMAGKREKGWNKEKTFKEGQKKQKLDDLFFFFIDVAKQLKPKVVISENVPGLLRGNAKGYVKEIIEKFNEAGYITQAFLLNSATMGVPQRRERCFFISQRKDFFKNKISFSFNEKPILFKEISDDLDKKPTLNKTYLNYWSKAKEGDSVGKYKCIKKVKMMDVCYTITASENCFHPKYPRKLNKNEVVKISSFPFDYDFCDINPWYVMGMSVPPVMMANISHQVYEQIFKRRNN